MFLPQLVDVPGGCNPDVSTLPPEGTFADREFVSTVVVTSDYDAALDDRADGCTVESSPMRIAVTRAWARLAAPSFW